MIFILLLNVEIDLAIFFGHFTSLELFFLFKLLLLGLRVHTEETVSVLNNILPVVLDVLFFNSNFPLFLHEAYVNTINLM